MRLCDHRRLHLLSQTQTASFTNADPDSADLNLFDAQGARDTNSIATTGVKPINSTTMHAGSHQLRNRGTELPSSDDKVHLSIVQYHCSRLGEPHRTNSATINSPLASLSTTSTAHEFTATARYLPAR